MARVPDLERFSKEHGVELVTVAQIIEYRHAFRAHWVRCAVETRLPTPFGEFRLRAYENDIDELTHVARSSWASPRERTMCSSGSTRHA